MVNCMEWREIDFELTQIAAGLPLEGNAIALLTNSVILANTILYRLCRLGLQTQQCDEELLAMVDRVLARSQRTRPEPVCRRALAQAAAFVRSTAALLTLLRGDVVHASMLLDSLAISGMNHESWSDAHLLTL